MHGSALRDGFEFAGLTCGKRVPRGELRWYVLQAPEGGEQAACEKIRRLAGPELVEDAFVVRKEQWFKRGGAWSLKPVQMYRGYLFVATRDISALDVLVSRTSVPAFVVGRCGRDVLPLSEDARRWLASSMDSDHVLRNSVGVIEDGVLHVQSGPLRGQESRVSKVDRHHRRCRVRVGGAGAVEAARGGAAGGGAGAEGDEAGGMSILMPLSVPARS